MGKRVRKTRGSSEREDTRPGAQSSAWGIPRELRRGAFVIGLGALLVGLSGPTARAAAPRRTVTAQRLIGWLRAGPVARRRLTIAGRLDLRGLGSVKHSFECRQCLFTGDVIGAGVVFGGTFDLSGSEFCGDVKMGEARFRGPVLFGSPPSSTAVLTTFEGNVDFSLARFDDVVSFERAMFSAGADFTLARFGGDAIFAGGLGAASGPGGAFDGKTVFERTSFASNADFRGRIFQQAATFERAGFGARADFSQARFRKGVEFNGVRFADDGIFFDAEFNHSQPGTAASFERATAAGRLDFSFATFRRGDADFTGVAAAVISFANARFPNRADALTLTDVSTSNFMLSVPVVKTSVLADDRHRVLGLIESSAKARGDLGIANDAHYEQEALASRRYSWPLRALDVVFYRWLAGYLVRPLRPLLALVGFAIAFSLFRFARAKSGQSEVERPSLRGVRGIPPRIRRWAHASGRIGNEFLDTLTLVARRRPTSESASSPPSRIEVLGYRTLIVCILLGLANSNPTLRQMVDALV